MILGAVDRIGLTKMGIALWFEMRAIFLEHMVEVGSHAGEPMFASSPQGAQRINASWENLWRTKVAIAHDPVYVEILGELTDRPRGRSDIVQRIVKKEPSINPRKVDSGIEQLLRAGVLTTNEAKIYVG